MNMLNRVANICPSVGRVLIALLYLISGMGLIGAFSNVTVEMVGKGLPIPDVLLGLTIALWLSGGVCLIFGWKVRLAAGIIFVAMIPVTLIFHAPWLADSAHFQGELNHFLMNLAIMGGLLHIVGIGTGEPVPVNRTAG